MKEKVQKIRTFAIIVAAGWAALNVVIQFLSFLGNMTRIDSIYTNSFSTFTGSVTIFITSSLGSVISCLIVILLALMLDPEKVAEIPLFTKKAKAPTYQPPVYQAPPVQNPPVQQAPPVGTPPMQNPPQDGNTNV